MCHVHRQVGDLSPEVSCDALAFAADKHRDQRRKGAEASPYINHPIALAALLSITGAVDDVEVLQAAVLHDTTITPATRLTPGSSRVQ